MGVTHGAPLLLSLLVGGLLGLLLWGFARFRRQNAGNAASETGDDLLLALLLLAGVALGAFLTYLLVIFDALE